MCASKQQQKKEYMKYYMKCILDVIVKKQQTCKYGHPFCFNKKPYISE